MSPEKLTVAELEDRLEKIDANIERLTVAILDDFILVDRGYSNKLLAHKFMRKNCKKQLAEARRADALRQSKKARKTTSRSKPAKSTGEPVDEYMADTYR